MILVICSESKITITNSLSSNPDSAVSKRHNSFCGAPSCRSVKQLSDDDEEAAKFVSVHAASTLIRADG